METMVDVNWRSSISCCEDDEGMCERRGALGWVAMEDGGATYTVMQTQT